MAAPQQAEGRGLPQFHRCLLTGDCKEVSAKMYGNMDLFLLFLHFQSSGRAEIERYQSEMLGCASDRSRCPNQNAVCHEGDGLHLRGLLPQGGECCEHPSERLRAGNGAVLGKWGLQIYSGVSSLLTGSKSYPQCTYCSLEANHPLLEPSSQSLYQSSSVLRHWAVFILPCLSSG